MGAKAGSTTRTVGGVVTGGGGGVMVGGCGTVPGVVTGGGGGTVPGGCGTTAVGGFVSEAGIRGHSEGKFCRVYWYCSSCSNSSSRRVVALCEGGWHREWRPVEEVWRKKKKKKNLEDVWLISSLLVRVGRLHFPLDGHSPRLLLTVTIGVAHVFFVVEHSCHSCRYIIALKSESCHFMQKDDPATYPNEFSLARLGFVSVKAHGKIRPVAGVIVFTLKYHSHCVTFLI
eukprot:scaffold1112_cov92-Amphora_coffeaeformis.AAC.6